MLIRTTLRHPLHRPTSRPPHLAFTRKNQFDGSLVFIAMYIANYGLYYSYQYALSYSISLSVLCVRILRHTAKLNVDAAEYEINFYLFITYSYMSFIVQSLEESSTTIEYILLLLLLIGCYIEFIHCSRSSGIVRTVDGSTMGWNIDRTQSSIHWQNCILLLRMLP